MIAKYARNAVLVGSIILSLKSFAGPPPTIIGPFIDTYSVTDYRLTRIQYGMSGNTNLFPTWIQIDGVYESDNGISWSKDKKITQVLGPVYHRTVIVRDAVAGTASGGNGTETVTTIDTSNNSTTTVGPTPINATELTPMMAAGSVNSTVPGQNNLETWITINQNCHVSIGFTGGDDWVWYKYRFYFTDTYYRMNTSGDIVPVGPVAVGDINVPGRQIMQAPNNQYYFDILIRGSAPGVVTYVDITPMVNVYNIYHRWYYNSITLLQ